MKSRSCVALAQNGVKAAPHSITVHQVAQHPLRECDALSRLRERTKREFNLVLFPDHVIRIGGRDVAHFAMAVLDRTPISASVTSA